MAFIGLIASLAGSAISAMGAMQQANAAAAAAEYNAKIQEQNAQMARDQSSVVAGQKIRESRQRSAGIVAGTMQNGFEVAGSPLDVLGQAETQGYLDYLTALYDGKVAATGYQNNANLYRMEAKSARQAGAIGAASAMVGGLSDIYRSGGSVQLTV
jgi:curli biogenesis system outer membrane secretion channel CsgG